MEIRPGRGAKSFCQMSPCFGNISTIAIQRTPCDCFAMTKNEGLLFGVKIGPWDMKLGPPGGPEFGPPGGPPAQIRGPISQPQGGPHLIELVLPWLDKTEAFPRPSATGGSSHTRTGPMRPPQPSRSRRAHSRLHESLTPPPAGGTHGFWQFQPLSTPPLGTWFRKRHRG